ncbi:hypothetical protein [Actinoplanes sp. DH11]|uniref:hypothetical protein n=1 Tax=Actinoplanes sp. DH11 TaxID=2857011 RepID=UPI001E40B525|nr:hypothetical protein [Actinoplanes sp. DH11]
MTLPQQRTSARTIGLVAAGVVLAGAAGVTAVAARGGSDESQAQPPPSEAPRSASTPPSSAPIRAALEVGQVHRFVDPDGVKVSVTVLAHKADGENYGIQVRTCNGGDEPFNASTRPWALSYGGGEELSQDIVFGGGLLAPAFVESELTPAACRKGWINYVRATGAPDGAEYSVEGLTHARWEW